MSEVPVFRFKAPGPWVTRDLKDCVLASDYDALAARLAAAERERDEIRDAAARLLAADRAFDAALAARMKSLGIWPLLKERKP